MLNPYAKYLGDRNPQQVLAETPDKLASIFKQLGPAGVEKSPAPGKWSAREIVVHLADCEIAFAFRLRQTLAEDNHVLQPFDQKKWAASYAAYNAEAALHVFAAIRQWNLTLVHSLQPEAMSKAVNHPERGNMTFATILELMGGHDLNHLQQLETIAATYAQ
jgi:uncharacterized damage-inducible protein DinB